MLKGTYMREKFGSSGIKQNIGIGKYVGKYKGPFFFLLKHLNANMDGF